MEEREIIVVNLVKGYSNKTKENFYRLDYVRKSNWTVHSDFISPIEYEKMKKKVSDKHMLECVGIVSLNDYDNAYISDIK